MQRRPVNMGRPHAYLERTIRILDALNVRLRTKVEIEPDKQEMAVA